MRLRFTAEMIEENGNRVSMPVEVETAVPNLGEFGDKSLFYEIFDRYERAVLEVHNQAAEGITESYLNAASTNKGGKREKGIEAKIGRIFIEIAKGWNY